jgi:hypothetical protein
MRGLSLMLLIAAACVPEKEPEVVLATTVESDLAELGEQVSLIGEAMVQLDQQAAALEDQALGVGDCLWKLEAESAGNEGLVSLDLDTTPCGGHTGPANALGLSFEEGAMAGSWTSTVHGEISAEFLGHRTATVAHGPRDYDASWTLLGLEIFASDEGVRSWSALLSYNDFVGETYIVDVRSVQGILLGDLLTPNKTCIVTGTLERPAVRCDLPPQ